MHKFLRTISLAILCAGMTVVVSAQLDEVRSITGMPIAIGQAVIYGQVSIQNIGRDDRRPSIFVSYLESGIQVERRSATSEGYFFFMRRARPGASLAFEINGIEVGRTVLTPTGSELVRQDISVDWRSLTGGSRSVGPSVIAAKDSYTRTPENEKTFESAMGSVRAGKNDQALQQFTTLVAADPTDHFAWTMLGTLQMTSKKNDDAAKSFAKALELKPEFTLALINYGRMELGRKDYPKAVELLSKAVAAEETSADANHYLGEAHLQNKKGSLAVGYMNRAIELAPVEKADLHLRLAALYNGAGMKDRAANEYKQFLTKVKDHPDRKEFEKYVRDNTPK
jgi:Tfp pilus assembly protein PilF